MTRVIETYIRIRVTQFHKLSVKEIEIDIAGAGEVNALQLKADKVVLHAAGACAAQVWAEKEITAEMNGAGSLSYKGNPAINNIKHAGISKVEKLPE